jgi:hypothetical protein
MKIGDKVRVHVTDRYDGSEGVVETLCSDQENRIGIRVSVAGSVTVISQIGQLRMFRPEELEVLSEHDFEVI